MGVTCSSSCTHPSLAIVLAYVDAYYAVCIVSIWRKNKYQVLGLVELDGFKLKAKAGEL